jgi:hypothetical protein
MGAVASPSRPAALELREFLSASWPAFRRSWPDVLSAIRSLSGQGARDLAWELVNQRVGETLLRAAGTSEVVRSLLAERAVGLPR